MIIYKIREKNNQYYGNPNKINKNKTEDFKMENEIMNFDGTEIMDETVVTGKKGLGAGKAALIGTGVILAGIAGFKLVKKAIAKHKAKKAECQDDEDYEEVSE